VKIYGTEVKRVKIYKAIDLGVLERAFVSTHPTENNLI
jgi:hypothetical protein